MSDLDRLEDEAIEPNEPTANDAGAAPTEGAEASATPKKKRRRGSRGGRNRKKKPANANANANGNAKAKSTEADADEEDEVDEAEDELIETDDSERGLTDEVVAEQAREEAGLPPSRPKIGDSRPAP